jgi:hypothetical protein
MQGGGRLFRPGAMTLFPGIREINHSRVLPSGQKDGEGLFFLHKSGDRPPVDNSLPDGESGLFEAKQGDLFPSAKQAKVANRFSGVEGSDEDAPIRRIPYGNERAL